MSKIAIIGAGFIGRAWAISFARAGHEVAFWDANADAPGAALAYIEGLLPELESFDLLGGASPARVLGRMSVAATLEAALQGAAHVQENTPEDLALKRNIFARLDAVAAPQTVLASSTSALLPSKFTEHLPGCGRCLVAHPINPPYLIPAVEVVPAPWTRPDVMETTATLLRSVESEPTPPIAQGVPHDR